MNNIRIDNYLLDLAARSPVAQLRTGLRNSEGRLFRALKNGQEVR